MQLCTTPLTHSKPSRFTSHSDTCHLLPGLSDLSNATLRFASTPSCLFLVNLLLHPPTHHLPWWFCFSRPTHFKITHFKTTHFVMASLTPGVLSKLLQNVDNKTAKVAGEHRSALLQVIGIVPSLSSTSDDINDDDPWKSRGFYLRVSDSLHSAYVSVSESDTDLILSDKIQLGQFIHVSRLDSGSPVPMLRGLKPVLKKRAACVGEPKDLISSDALLVRNVEAKPKLKLKPRVKPKVVEEERRVSLGNGKIEGLDRLRRLSLDPGRKAWDRAIPLTPKSKNGSSGVKSKQSLTPSLPSTPARANRKCFSEKDSPLEQPNPNILPLKNMNVIVSEKLISKPIKKDLKSSFEGSLPSHSTKVPISFKTWSDSKIVWDSVPPTIHDLGKEVINRRNVGFFSVVDALEETSASEGILRCMSVFAEICESAQQDSANPLVEQFLNFYHSIQNAAATINTLLDSYIEEKSSNLSRAQTPLPETCKTFKNKNAALWVQAAIDTGLSKFSLFRKEDPKDSHKGEKSHFVVLENTPPKTLVEQHHLPENKCSPGAVISNLSARSFPLRIIQRGVTTTKATVERTWTKGQGLKEAATLAEKLLSVSRSWFLNYLEDSLKKEFGLRKGEGGSEITILLGQLKRVNEWLDDLVGDGSRMDERVECLRKKLYKFLLDHVDSAIVQAGN